MPHKKTKTSANLGVLYQLRDHIDDQLRSITGTNNLAFVAKTLPGSRRLRVIATDITGPRASAMATFEVSDQLLPLFARI